MIKSTTPRDLLVAESRAMRAVAERIEDLSATAVPVLIEGEPGTGRELVARIIHMASARRLHGFVTIKGGTAPNGSFADSAGQTSVSALRRAERGSLLVKDFCALSRLSQEQLWHVVGHSVGAKLDVRVMATTDPELRIAVDAGVFSSELYACFEPYRLVLPPLRERITDIPPLATTLIKGYGRTMGRNRIRVSTRAFDRMLAYPWPGNVAELKAICRRLAVRAESGKVEAEDVDAVLPVVEARAPLEETSFEDMVRSKLVEFLRKMDGYPIEGLYEQVLDRVERPLLSVIMDYTGQNQVRAAEILGVSRNTLRRKLSERGVRAQPRGVGRAAAARRRRGTRS